jgi:tetratricopeptide (TPR) repeat protein
MDMSYIARLALFLCRAAQFWPIASPRAKFQMHALGVAFDSYLQDERTAEAAALVPQYLRLVRTVYGPNPQGRVGAVCMSRQVDFGRILHAAGGTEEGSALVKQCVDWFKQHPPEEDAVWGACLLNLGGVLVHLQQPQEAIEWLEEASQLWRRVHGPDSYEVAQCQNNLGVAYQDLGQLDAAERAQREALRLNELAAEHGRGVAIALNNLSATLNKGSNSRCGLSSLFRTMRNCAATCSIPWPVTMKRLVNSINR